ncbi:MAG: hypothetical protein IJL71_00490 [Oscillospiraceae bacterium]|nr:hypothetical protein [Oscillospiraceae bacterium]
MEIIVMDIAAVFIVCGGFLLLIWLLTGLALTPVPVDDNTKLFMVIAVNGDGGSFEQTIHSLEWLRSESRIPMELVVADCGLDDHGQKLTGLAMDRTEYIFCKPAALDRLIGEHTWLKEQTK